MGLTTEEQKAVEAFRQDVVAPSMDRLVILDFWAEWCGPCKQLAPVLEKVAADYADRGVHLAKINVDQNSFIAAQFQVRSIPTVYAIFQGQPVADLTPMRTEAQLAGALDQLLAQLPVNPAGAEADPLPELPELLAQGEDLLSTGHGEQAYMLFAQILDILPDNGDALGGLIRALVLLDRIDEAAEMLTGLPDDLAGHSAVERARSAVALASDRRDPTEVQALRAKVEADPADHQARFDLANALIGAGDHDGGADALLAIIAAERDWNEGAARAKLLQLFETIGLEDQWVAATRRRLSAALFG